MFVQINARDYTQNSIFYSSVAERDVMEFLASQEDGGVLAAPGSSMLITMISGKRSMIAAENYGFSRDWMDHVEDFSTFFSSGNSATSRVIAEKYKIRYVYVSPRELQYGNVEGLDFLHKIYEKSKVVVYVTDI